MAILHRFIIAFGTVHLLISFLATVNEVQAMGDLGELLIVSRLLGGGLGGARTFGCHQARQTSTGGGLGGIDAQPNTLNDVGYVDSNFGPGGNSYPGDARAVLLNRQDPMPIRQAASSVSETIIPGLVDTSSIERQDSATLAKLTSSKITAPSFNSDVSYITAGTGSGASSRMPSNQANNENRKVEISASLWDASATEENWAHSVSASASDRNKKKVNFATSKPTTSTRKPEAMLKVPPKAAKPVIKVLSPAALSSPFSPTTSTKRNVPTTTAATPLVSASEKSKVAKLLTKFLQKPAEPANMRLLKPASKRSSSSITDAHVARSSADSNPVSTLASDANSFWSFRRRKRQIILGGGDTGIMRTKH